MIWDNFSIFRTNCAIVTSYIRADPRTCKWLSRGCCHVAWSKWWVWRDSLADFSQRWHGIRQGIWSRSLTCSCMPWANGKGEFFRVENNFALWMNMICSHSQVERVSFCLCSRQVMKEDCLLCYRVNFESSQTMLNHDQNLFLIVCYCSVCLHWRVCKSFWVAHLHNTARALASPNRCFQYCQQILTKIYFVVFCAEILQQFPLTPKGC